MQESVRSLMFLVGAYYFLQGTGGNLGLHDLAMKQYLTKDLGLNEAQLADFVAFITIPWMIKPLYGIITDSLPLFGYRIRSYFVLSSIIALGGFGGVFLFGYKESSLAFCLFVVAVGFAFADVICDKLMVIKGKSFGALKELQSGQWSANAIAGILNTFLGGYIATYILLQHAVGFSAVAALLTIIVTLYYVKEGRASSVSGAAHETWSGMRAAFRSRPLLGCAVFIFLFNLSPSVDSTLYMYETKTLQFSDILIGHIDAVGQVGFLVGALAFKKISRRMSEEWLLRSIIICGALAMLSYVFFTSPFNAFIVSFVYWVTLGISSLGILTIAARVCPAHAEGTVFAFLMSIYNFGKQMGNMIGGRLLMSIGFTPLVVLSALFTLAMWFFLPLVRENKSS